MGFSVPPGLPPSASLPLASAEDPPAPTRRRRRHVWPVLVGLSALATGVAVAVPIATWTPADTQYLHDTYVAWSEPVSDEVAAIAQATGMSHEGELVYRASRPAVEDSEVFNEHCALEGGAVLGCYAAGTIYVYDVTDERLAGTVEVTAAHEMLHAAYERLSEPEREEVDALVADYIASIPEDDPIYQDLALYAPGQLADEWHARLGTEFADLPAALEQHYARWFDDRAKVLELHVQANAAFRALQDQIEALVVEVDALGPAIDTRIAAYDSAASQYAADVASFNTRAENGSFTSREQFDRERAALVARGEALDAEVAAINEQVARYNELVAQLTALDADYAELYSALDPTADPETVSP
jgi:cell division protein FtsB